MMQNETWRRRLFPWERIKPSSPVASSPIVVMDNRHDKTEMTTLVDIAFKENNIQAKYTRLGKDVIFRKASRQKKSASKSNQTLPESLRGKHVLLLQVFRPCAEAHSFVRVSQGDPCLQHDLVRVAAHKATSVLITMTEADLLGKEESDGATSNSATIRACLALRNGSYVTYVSSLCVS
jgi:hypothetical protein